MAGTIITGAEKTTKTSTDTNDNNQIIEQPVWQSGREYVNKFSYYTRKEVQQHNTPSSLWITYNKGVYDITSFLSQHPGTDSMIYLAVNGNHDIGSFWTQLGFHNNEEIHKRLEQYRIGNLDSKDVINTPFTKPNVDNELLQQRQSLLKHAFSLEPFIAETPVEKLRDFYTPNEYFYVRNHNPVPTHLSWDDTITVDASQIPKKFSKLQSIEKKYSDLKQMKTNVVDMIVQCGGHRRREFNKYGATSGSKWDVGSVGNAKFTGVLLRDFLKECGVDVDAIYNDTSKEYHVWFVGADTDPRGEGYGVSIPVSKALDPRGDVMIAYLQNGEELTRDHGFPARVVVPGWVGARYVKWIEQIIISDKPCDYRSFTTMYRMVKDDVFEIRALPVNSSILEPVNNSVLPLNTKQIHVQGEAHSGDGNGIIRVDVSVDGGNSWHAATIQNANQPFKQYWSWVKWAADIDISKELIEKMNGKLQIVCRAYDTSHNRQNESCKDDLLFNSKGYLVNSYHKVDVQLK